MSDESESMMIEIEGVSVSFGDVEVLDGVDASVTRGEFVGLVGPNGAGKTTLLRTINAVLAPDEGRVAVDDEVVARLPAGETGTLVATVPQNTHLSFAFDVRRVVAMGRHPYISRFGTESERDRTLVERAMERTDVTDLTDRSIEAVSGGERQRVLLARALAQDTPVILLDEPTASLDVNHQVRTFELVADLVAEGTTVVAAIHDLNLAAHYCDALLLLHDGGILASGPPGEVLTEQHLEAAFGTRAAVGRHPVTGSTHVTALPEADGDLEGRIHVVAGGGNASQLLYRLAAAGYEVSVGALNEGDSDLRTARHLDLDVVVAPPYAGVDDGIAEEVRERVGAAEVTVVADVEVGPGNLPNLAAARTADRLLVVEERPFDERNYAGERGRAVYERLRESGRIVESEGIDGAVRAALEGATAGTEPRVRTSAERTDGATNSGSTGDG